MSLHADQENCPSRENISILNMYVPNAGSSHFIKQTHLDLKSQINSNTVAVGDFITSLLPFDTPAGQTLMKQPWD